MYWMLLVGVTYILELIFIGMGLMNYIDLEFFVYFDFIKNMLVANYKYKQLFNVSKQIFVHITISIFTCLSIFFTIWNKNMVVKKQLIYFLLRCIFSNAILFYFFDYYTNVNVDEIQRKKQYRNLFIYILIVLIIQSFSFVVK